MSRRKFDRYMLVVGAGRNRKFARLTDSERCAHFLGVLSVAAQSPCRGYLLVTDGEEAGPEEVASEAGVPRRVAESALAKLKRVGVLKRDEERGAWFVHDWDDINPSPGAERTRRWRDDQTSPKRHVSVTGNGGDHHGNRHGERHANVTKPSPEVKKLKEEEEAKASSRRGNRAEEKSTEEDRRLCRLLADLAKQRNSKFKVRSRSRWLIDMRLLRERDGNAPEELEEAVRWVFQHHFWSGVIQSPGNLREHFPKIWGQMHQPLRAVPAVEDSAAFLARRGAA